MKQHSRYFTITLNIIAKMISSAAIMVIVSTMLQAVDCSYLVDNKCRETIFDRMIDPQTQYIFAISYIFIIVASIDFIKAMTAGTVVIWSFLAAVFVYFISFSVDMGAMRDSELEISRIICAAVSVTVPVLLAYIIVSKRRKRPANSVC